MIQGDINLTVIELLVCGILFFLAGYAEKNLNSKWRIFYIIPVIICLVFICLTGFEISMLGAYIGSALLLAGFFKDNAKIRKISCGVSAAVLLVSLAVASNYSGYRRIDYADDFRTAFAKMKQFYILAEHKNVDWDALYDEYLPKFQAGTKSGDEIGNIITWMEFSSEFRDGHVGFAPNGDYETEMELVYERVFGNDYGLALMTLSDGRTAAVNVDPMLNSMGIENGTIITSWDGGDPMEIGAGLMKYSPIAFADKDNEMFYRALYAAGQGGESVTVTYLDESGSEQTALLPKIGNYYSGRMKAALEIIDGGIETGHLMWADINENTAALRIKMMMADSTSAKTGDHSRLKNSIVIKLDELKAAGVTNIILDMRSNGGGTGAMVQALAEIFAPAGKHYYSTDGVWDSDNKCYLTDPETGKFVKGKDNYYTAEGYWDGEVVILVNSSAISAADHTIEILDDFESITVMGFTEPNGSAQGIGSVSLKSGTFQFSSALMLNKNGDVFIDSGADYESGNGTEIIIPFDEEAVNVLFNNGEDYLLNKAVAYLETK